LLPACSTACSRLGAARAGRRSSWSRSLAGQADHPEYAARDTSVIARPGSHWRKAQTRELTFSSRLSRERERKQRTAGGDGDVLLAVHRIAHGTAVHLSTKRGLPQQAAALRIER